MKTDYEAEAEAAAAREIEDEALRARIESDGPPRTSWSALDTAARIREGLDPEPPTMLRRTDGQGLLYPGKTHTFVGEPESGKTWAALAACQEMLQRGAGVLYVDFEDSHKGIVRRLFRELGTPDNLATKFGYLRPDIPFTVKGAKESFIWAADRYQPEIIVLDGVTECMALHGWDINSATDVAKFLDTFPRLWDRLACVVLIDHVVKAEGPRGKWAIGSQHKLAGVNGASYTFTVDTPLGKNRTGVVQIGVAKDREGEVRGFADDDGKAAGTFYFEGAADRTARWSITPYNATTHLATFEQKIVEALADGPLNKGELHARIGGKRNIVWGALREMEDGGRVTVTSHGREKIVALA